MVGPAAVEAHAGPPRTALRTMRVTQLEKDLISANLDVLPAMWNDNGSGNAAIWFGKEHAPGASDPLGLKEAYRPDPQNAQSQFRTYEALTAAGLVKFYEVMEGRQRQAKANV